MQVDYNFIQNISCEQQMPYNEATLTEGKRVKRTEK